MTFYTSFWTTFLISLFIVLNIYSIEIGVHGQLNLDNIKKLDLNRQLPEEYAKSNFSLNEFKELVRNKCINVSGEKLGGEAYTEIEAGLVTLGECITTLVNFTTVQQEIEKASPLGQLDEVFNKYCKKRTNALECFDVFNSKLIPCLSTEEQDSQNVLIRIIRSLLNFVCHKDGDQIALFIAEKGPECLESQKDNIQQCLNSTFSTYMNISDIQDTKIKSLPLLVMGDKQCDDLKNLETCIVHHLEKCSEITPANLVESMFNFIKNETMCSNSKKSNASKQSAENASNIPSVNLFLVNIILLFMFAWKSELSNEL
ncbi:27 kDa glycoprotein [Scaptodrosophila lebanonensis]|uniref:27 kDa glycoprotein n=1 Tax=Drosophila lebanonensis TaxID=7225 RepID=A0A6J2TXA3_DROLE|nr:27 kDa glycoprotein [Scaptodrosophila lebanonensis]